LRKRIPGLEPELTLFLFVFPIFPVLICLFPFFFLNHGFSPPKFPKEAYGNMPCNKSFEQHVNI
jgi:hypothetical protein